MILICRLSSPQAPSGSGGTCPTGSPSSSRGIGALGLQGAQCPKEAGSTKGGVPGICRGALVCVWGGGGRYRQAQCWLLRVMHGQSQPPPLRAPRPAPRHHTPAHPQEERRRELNFLRLYWARGCPAFQAGPSSSCTRDGLAGESVLSVPATALLHLFECLLLFRSATLPWGQAIGTPGSPACQVILAVLLAVSGPWSAYPPWEDVTSLSKDRSAPQYQRVHGSRWSSGLPFCESLQLLLLEAFVSHFPSGSNILNDRASDPREPGIHIP